MVPKWCFGVDSHKTCIHTHTHTHIPSFLSSLTLHHHANPACFTRQETERLIVIPQGSADLSQICLLPRSSFHIIPVLFGSQESENLSSLGSTGNVGNLWVKPSPLGDSLPELRESLKGKLSKDGEGDRGRLYFVPSSRGLQSQSCSNIERKCLAKLGLVARLLCVTGGGLKTVVGYILEGSMCLSLNDQSSSISDALSLPVYHTERRAAFMCFRRQYPTQYCLYSPSLFSWHPLFA